MSTGVGNYNLNLTMLSGEELRLEVINCDDLTSRQSGGEVAMLPASSLFGGRSIRYVSKRL